MPSAILAQSLNNLTVPDGTGSNQTLLSPKLQYRFRIRMDGFGAASTNSTEITKQVIDFTRPTIQFPEVTLPVYNSTIYLAGRGIWQPLTLTVRDDTSNAVTKAVAQQLQKQMDFLEQASGVTGQSYKFSMYCEMLDGGNGQYEPIVLETWEIAGCFLQQVNYNQVSYASNEPVTIQMNIRFDNALNTDTAGSYLGGTAARRTLQGYPAVSGTGTT